MTKKDWIMWLNSVFTNTGNRKKKKKKIFCKFFHSNVVFCIILTGSYEKYKITVYITNRSIAFCNFIIIYTKHFYGIIYSFHNSMDRLLNIRFIFNVIEKVVIMKQYMNFVFCECLLVNLSITCHQKTKKLLHMIKQWEMFRYIYVYVCFREIWFVVFSLFVFPLCFKLWKVHYIAF